MYIYRDRKGNICYHRNIKKTNYLSGSVKVEPEQCKDCDKLVKRTTFDAHTGRTITIETF